MKRVLIAVAVGLLVACTPQSDPLAPGQKRDEQTGVAYSNTVLLTMDDGCVVSNLDIRNNGSMKIVKCPVAAASLYQQSGKTSYQSLSIPVEETDAQRKAREAAWEQRQRDAAVAKLTDAERKLLGIPK